ncbi:unnamed protein product [Pieris brassicae]|uniref:Uncharacterized protein n=1 Tax=Pieris brassicae TaxID=7116 RepID=A0A9P0SZZ3_PIEBR|nr:unnamed protein product [Pieris brassicae]
MMKACVIDQRVLADSGKLDLPNNVGLHVLVLPVVLSRYLPRVPHAGRVTRERASRTQRRREERDRYRIVAGVRPALARAACGDAVCRQAPLVPAGG